MSRRPAPHETLAGRLPLATGGLAGFDEVRTCDVLIVGSGAAGLSAGLAAANATEHVEQARASQHHDDHECPRVVIATKLSLGQGGSTPWAQGGIAAAVGPDDSPQQHADDTVVVGRGLCERDAVCELTKGGPEAIEQLLRHGTRFDRSSDGDIHLGREGGHSEHRILHSDGDRTGAEISRALVAAVRAHPRIGVEEGYFAADLLVWHGPLGKRVTGIAGLQNGRKVAYVARAVILACGGAGQIYRHTTNPRAVTGDGIAMAARAGARLADLEFFQFHPTTLDVHHVGREVTDAPSPLLTEALRGAGALLVGKDGQRFMQELHELAELAPRDLVARTLWQRRTRGEASFLDLRPVIAAHGPLQNSFPTAAASCAAVGLDPDFELIPVVPAAHYYMGGVWTDAQGRTSLPGLWAAGEVTSSGVHGANRLASNSLLEALVFGDRVARRALLASAATTSLSHLRSGSRPAGGVDWNQEVECREETKVRSKMAEILWRDAGLLRTDAGLSRAAAQLEHLARCVEDQPGEVRNLLLVARLLVAAALRRTESRGGHYRADFPATDPKWAGRSFVEMHDLVAAREEVAEQDSPLGPPPLRARS